MFWKNKTNETKWFPLGGSIREWRGVDKETSTFHYSFLLYTISLQPYACLVVIFWRILFLNT